MKSIAICVLVSYLGFCSQASGQSGRISRSVGPESQSAYISPARKTQLTEDYGKLPLSFEANTGQADKSVKFVSRGKGYGLYLTGEEAVMALLEGGCAGRAAGGGLTAASRGRPGLRRIEAACSRETAVVRMRLEGSSGAAAPVGEEQLPGTSNYFIGNDPAKWRTSVPTYARVRYRGVYPGVDLIYYGNQRQLEYDFVVASGTDPKCIRLRFAGAKGLRLGADGNLVVTAAGGAMALHKPVVYQMVNERRRAVVGGFVLLAGHTVGFRLGTYDRGRPLVIDPVLVYSTYLGGDDLDGAGRIVTDTAGNAYVIGSAMSADFPVTSGALQTMNNVCGKPFVAKLNPTGSTLVYSTYLGGSGCDFAIGLAVDGSGNAYIAGEAASADFPVTPGVFQTTKSGYDAGFVSKLNATGSALIYSTYLGGINGSDSAQTLAIDGSGNAYIAGAATDANFPVTQGAYQMTNNNHGLGTNGFVTKLNPTGSTLIYSTYLGGSGVDGVIALAVDSGGNAYVAGSAYSTNFPVTVGAFQTTNFGDNAFVTKLNPAGTALVYSTFIGGSGQGNTFGGLAVDGSGNAYITGCTDSANFPVTQGAFQTTNNAAANVSSRSGCNAFVTKLNPAGSALVYSTYLGGSVEDIATGLAVDGSGNAYITGSTLSADFPVTQGAFQMTNKAAANDSPNAFVTELNSTGSALVYSTYFGGSGSNRSIGGDGAGGIALDNSGNAYIAGTAYSTDFPVTVGAFQTKNAARFGGSNAFLAKMNLSVALPAPSITPGGIVAVDSTVTTIQEGEFVSIYGTNLGPASPATWTGNFVTSLGGTSVTIDGNAAYLTYASSTQINLQAPNNANTTTRSVPVVVTAAAGTASSTVTLAEFAPSFLLFDSKHVTGIILRPDGSGSQGGGAYDLLGPTGNSLGFPTVAAKPGDSVQLYAVGLGPTTPPVPAGQTFSSNAPTTNQVNLLINSMSVLPSFAGLDSSLLYQINLTVPVGLGTGDVPLVATVGGVQTQSGVVISLQ